MRLRGSGRAKLGVTLSVGGMAALCLGFKAAAAAMFATGMYQLERDWRGRHPEFQGTWAERWQLALDFYGATHVNSTNRVLHMVGIPLIAGGAAGLFASARLTRGGLWLGSVSAFGTGWLLNLAGHAVYEKRAPAFSADGLSFFAGPVWDVKQFFDQREVAV